MAANRRLVPNVRVKTPDPPRTVQDRVRRCMNEECGRNAPRGSNFCSSQCSDDYLNEHFDDDYEE